MPLAQHRTGRNLPIFLGLFFVVWTLRATVMYRVDELLPAGGARSMYALLSKFLLWTIPALLYAVSVRGDRPRHSMRLGWPDFSRQGWLTWVVGVLALAVVAWDVTRRHDASFADLGAALLQHGFGVAWWALPAAAIEETFFRGLVLTEFSERLRFWAANATTALLFVAIHWPHWLWAREFGGALLRDSLGIFCVGLVTGYLTRQTRSIWPGTIWHAASNCLNGVW